MKSGDVEGEEWKDLESVQTVWRIKRGRIFVCIYFKASNAKSDVSQ